MKILGWQDGHDVSYCILENGIPIIHEELERFTRIKSQIGDGLGMFFEHNNKKDIILIRNLYYIIFKYYFNYLILYYNIIKYYYLIDYYTF